MEWFIWLGIGIVGLAITLIFEDSREYIIETFEYIISFEWFSDFWDFICSAFEDIGEFSIYGIAFGLLSLILIFYTREQMIVPFVQYYEPVARMFWTIATYVTVFVGGYLMGKAFENS